MRLPTAEMPLRMAVSMLFIMLLDVSGKPCRLLATSLQHHGIPYGPVQHVMASRAC